jgi:hypothetical protein
MAARISNCWNVPGAIAAEDSRAVQVIEPTAGPESSESPAGAAVGADVSVGIAIPETEPAGLLIPDMPDIPDIPGIPGIEPDIPGIEFGAPLGAGAEVADEAAGGAVEKSQPGFDSTETSRSAAPSANTIRRPVVRRTKPPLPEGELCSRSSYPRTPLPRHHRQDAEAFPDTYRTIDVVGAGLLVPKMIMTETRGNRSSAVINSLAGGVPAG